MIKSRLTRGFAPEFWEGHCWLLTLHMVNWSELLGSDCSGGKGERIRSLGGLGELVAWTFYDMFEVLWFVVCLYHVYVLFSLAHYRFRLSYFIFKGKDVTMSHRFFIACMQYFISRYASILPYKSIMPWTPSASEPIFGLLIDNWLLWIPYERQHLVVSALLVWVARVSRHWNVPLPH